MFTQGVLLSRPVKQKGHATVPWGEMTRYPEGLKFDLHDRAQMDQEYLIAFFFFFKYQPPQAT